MPTDTYRPEAAAQAVADLLRALGEDPDSERLRGTPARVAQTLHGAIVRPELPEVTFVERTESQSLITIRDIPFQSLCEHHLLPFRGTVDVAYIPQGRIVGVSLPVRVVEHFSHGLQLQERMTDEIADWLHEHLDARGSGVIVRAEHLCMSFRGIGGTTTSLQTSALRGELTAFEHISTLTQEEELCLRES